MSAIYHNLTNWKRSGCPFIDCDPGERERECTPSLEAGAAGDGERDSVRDDGGRDRQSPHITAGLLHFTTHKLTAFCLNETSHHFASSCSRQLGDEYCRILLMSSSL